MRDAISRDTILPPGKLDFQASSSAICCVMQDLDCLVEYRIGFVQMWGLHTVYYTNGQVREPRV